MRVLLLVALVMSAALAAAGCGDNEAGADDAFVENVADTTLNPTPTPEGELGATTALGEFKGEAERGFGVPLEVALGERLAVEEVINVTLTFLEVREDTRCPAGQTCDDPGRAAIVVSVLTGGLSLGETEFALEGGGGGRTQEDGGQPVDPAAGPAASAERRWQRGHRLRSNRSADPLGTRPGGRSLPAAFGRSRPGLSSVPNRSAHGRMESDPTKSHRFAL